MAKCILAGVTTFLLVSGVGAEEIRILTWNVESDRPDRDTNDPVEIAKQLEQLQADRGLYDLVGLTEVHSSSADHYEAALDASGTDYTAFISSTGGTDRMMLLIRTERFSIVGTGARELVDDGGPGGGGVAFPGGGARRPFLVTLRDHDNNDLELIFMVNHLTRGNDLNRRRQAEGLREWARVQTLPIIAVGDYNFDFDFRNLTGNVAMAIFMRQDASDGGEFVWHWVIPNAEFDVDGSSDATRKVNLLASFVDTNWAGSNGTDAFRDSILDFIFVAQGARDWGAESTVIIRPGDFPDNEKTSDHRPVEAVLDPGGTSVDVGGPSE